MWQSCKDHDHNVIKRLTEWGLLSPMLITQIPIEYIEKLLSLDNRRIEVVNNIEGEKEDIVQDLVSIITSFCARIYGQRRSKRATEKLIKTLEENNKNDASGKTCGE